MRKKFVTMFLIIIALIVFMPTSVEAEAYTGKCTYKIKNPQGLKTLTLDYTVKMTNSSGYALTPPFPLKDVKQYDDGGAFFGHVKSFEKEFLAATSEGVCPTITIEYDGNNQVSIWPRNVSGSACVGDCTQYTPSSSSLKNTEGKKVKTNSQTTCNGIGMWQDKTDYFSVTYLMKSNGDMYWKIDKDHSNGSEIKIDYNNPLNSAIDLKGNKGKVVLTQGIIDAVFDKDKNTVKCPSKTYRCVTNESTEYTYTLATSKTAGGDACLQSNDGQDYDSKAEKRENKANLDGLNQAIECSVLFAQTDEGSVFWIIQRLLNYIKIFGPILVVLLSAIDYIKAVFASEEDAMKKANKKLMIRLVAAIALFLIPTIVGVLLNLINGIENPTCGIK